MIPILKVEGISKNFGAICAVDNVSFEVYQGEIVGLVGDNGAGKSTLIKIISGVITPDKGKIFWNGKQINIISPSIIRDLGIETIYQDLSLADNLDVSANIFLGKENIKKYLGGIIRVLDENKMKNESIKVLEDLGIEITHDAIKQPIEKMSGGQRQSVAISKAVYWNVKLMIMDEPTSALGVKERKNVLNLVKKLEDKNTAVIYISHNLLDIIEVTHRIIILRHGYKIGEEKTSEISEQKLMEHMMGINIQNKIFNNN